MLGRDTVCCSQTLCVYVCMCVLYLWVRLWVCPRINVCVGAGVCTVGVMVFVSKSSQRRSNLFATDKGGMNV